MNVKDLKKKLEGADDEAVVVLSGSDHSYYENSGVEMTTAGRWPNGHMSEWYTPEDAHEDETPIPVLLVY